MGFLDEEAERTGLGPLETEVHALEAQPEPAGDQQPFKVVRQGALPSKGIVALVHNVFHYFHRENPWGAVMKASEATGLSLATTKRYLKLSPVEEQKPVSSRKVWNEVLGDHTLSSIRHTAHKFLFKQEPFTLPKAWLQSNRIYLNEEVIAAVAIDKGG